MSLLSISLLIKSLLCFEWTYEWGIPSSFNISLVMKIPKPFFSAPPSFTQKFHLDCDVLMLPFSMSSLKYLATSTFPHQWCLSTLFFTKKLLMIPRYLLSHVCQLSLHNWIQNNSYVGAELKFSGHPKEVLFYPVWHYSDFFRNLFPNKPK